MSRPLRIEFPGALHHVTSRGNARNAIFLDDRDRNGFLAVLREVVEQQRWECHAYCLMPNHYHLLVATPEANLSRGMRQLNGVYTQRFNRRHDRVGHVFQGRFHAVLVEREGHLLEVSRYIVLNPVRAGIVEAAEAYPWSSVRRSAGLDPMPDWLSRDVVRAAFGSPARYLQFVHAGVEPAEAMRIARVRGTILGSERFVKSLGRQVETKASEIEIPRRERLVHRATLAELFPPDVVRDTLRRNERIQDANRQRGYRVAEISRHLGLHYTTVSRIAARQSCLFPRSNNTPAALQDKT